MQQHHQLVEEASPISSRPPASGNLEELMRMSSGGDEGGGGPSGNRWPRQETLALLKIRSDMDAVFRDANVKGPLWEDVSRKLAELGYKRSAKKCKEKFENVHKYYKRTKEGRAGRQDGKTYKFFTELEALQAAPLPTPATVTTAALDPPLPPTSVTLDVAPVSFGIPMPVSSSRLPPNPSTVMFGADPQAPSGSQPPSAAPSFGVSFSSDSSDSESSQLGSGDEGSDNEMETEVGGGSRKRKRPSSTKSGGGSTRRMMVFFEGLMMQVMQKQELMQQRFLEAIEKREQETMVREEAWKRQEVARLAHEHELMAQERAITASRDAAIVSFLQKITGQTVQLPTATTVTVPAAPTPAPPPAQPPPVVPAPTSTLSQPPAAPPPVPQPQQQQQRPQQQQQMIRQQHRPQSTQVGGTEIVMAVPEQQVPPSLHEMGGSNTEPTSSRWPKTEVLALMKIRSGLEHRYQDAGPKGPLWEEISAAMLRLGYKRSSKRCKEKWENINKYYKKVKESNKKRPEDAKTCPYFHELDALYRQKILGGGSSTSATVGGGAAPLLIGNYAQQQPGEQSSHRQQQQSIQTGDQRDNHNGKNAGDQESKAGLPGSLFERGNSGQAHKPEDLVRELMEQERHDHDQDGHQQPFSVDDLDKIEDPESENMEEDEEEDEDDESDEERKMEAYKMEFQIQKGGGNGPPSFLAMVQ